MDLKTNPLLWASIAIGAGYWILAPLTPNPALSVIMATAVMIAAIVALAEYGPEAWRIVIHRKRSADKEGRGRGSHLAIYGFFLFASGSIFAGGYVLVWSWLGQPGDWIGSAPANFGRFCHAVGFALMQAGPALREEGLVLTRSWWLTFIGAVALVLLGFYLGMQVKAVEMTDGLAARRPTPIEWAHCPEKVAWHAGSTVGHVTANRC